MEGRGGEADVKTGLPTFSPQKGNEGNFGAKGNLVILRGMSGLEQKKRKLYIFSCSMFLNKDNLRGIFRIQEGNLGEKFVTFRGILKK